MFISIIGTCSNLKPFWAKLHDLWLGQSKIIGICNLVTQWATYTISRYCGFLQMYKSWMNDRFSSYCLGLWLNRRLCSSINGNGGIIWNSYATDTRDSMIIVDHYSQCMKWNLMLSWVSSKLNSLKFWYLIFQIFIFIVSLNACLTYFIVNELIFLSYINFQMSWP